MYDPAVIKTWLAAWFYSLPLLLRGDVGVNLGTKRNYRNTFLICHWNLEVFLFKAHIAI